MQRIALPAQAMKTNSHYSERGYGRRPSRSTRIASPFASIAQRLMKAV
jgi:hypothetical protein